MRRYLRDSLWVFCVLALIGVMASFFKPEPAPPAFRDGQGHGPGG